MGQNSGWFNLADIGKRSIFHCFVRFAILALRYNLNFFYITCIGLCRVQKTAEFHSIHIVIIKLPFLQQVGNGCVQSLHRQNGFNLI
jgi:hypothetical protein